MNKGDKHNKQNQQNLRNGSKEGSKNNQIEYELSEPADEKEENRTKQKAAQQNVQPKSIDFFDPSPMNTQPAKMFKSQQGFTDFLNKKQILVESDAEKEHLKEMQKIYLFKNDPQVQSLDQKNLKDEEIKIHNPNELNIIPELSDRFEISSKFISQNKNDPNDLASVLLR